MKHPALWAKMQRFLFTLTCLAVVPMLSQCQQSNKGDLKTSPALKGRNVVSNPEKILTADKFTPPIGFWTDEESSLYVSIRPRGEKVQDEEFAVGDLVIIVGGPPNKRMNADDVFFPSKQVLEGSKLSLTGYFNWDRNKNEVDLEVSWTASSVELQIIKNEKFTQYEAKRYVLKLRK